MYEDRQFVDHSSYPQQYEQSQQQHSLHAFESFPRFNFESFPERRESRAIARPSYVEHRPPVRHSEPVRQNFDASARIIHSSNERFYNHPPAYHSSGPRLHQKVSVGHSHFSRDSKKQPSRKSHFRPKNSFGPAKSYSSAKAFSSSSNKRQREKKKQYSFPSGFRDFHETFYGKKRAEVRTRQNKEDERVDNSLLGSGNFEVLTGGMYKNSNKNIHKVHHHPYDSYLDEDYSYSERQPQYKEHNNYVDDFFSNFRDFSEISERRKPKPQHYDDDHFGYDSENQYVYHDDIRDEQPQLPTKSHSSFSVNENRRDSHTSPSVVGLPEKSHSSFSMNGNRHDSHTSPSVGLPSYHRPPRNIQEIVAMQESQSDSVQDSLVDPMMATF